MKLSDVIMEVQNTLECERKSYDDGACQDENIKGWIEALEYTQGLLNKVKPNKYNGYTNKPTWQIMSWINNDQVLYFHFNEILSKMIVDAPTGKLVIDFANYIKNCITYDNVFNNIAQSSPIADILNYVIDIINWEEIAEHLIDDVINVMEDK